MKPKYRVLNCELLDGERFQVSMSALREISFRREIEKGERECRILGVAHQTLDRNEARALAREV